MAVNGGNPNHDENGLFTTPEKAVAPGQGKERTQDTTSTDKPKRQKKVAKEKFENAFDMMMLKLQDLTQSMKVPPLSTGKDIEDHCTEFFSKNVVEHLDKLVGKSQGCSSYQFHPASNPYVSLNIYTCVFGKYRYPNNHAHYINSQEEFNQMLASGKYERVYRGISSVGDKRKKILDGYVTADINNLDIYGNGVYGTNVYTTIRHDYAYSYANRSESNIIQGMVDRDARYINSYNLNHIQNNLNYDNISAKVKDHLLKQGLQDDRADKIAKQFSLALRSDESLVAILLGYDYQISDGHQRNILNLNKWHIRREM